MFIWLFIPVLVEVGCTMCWALGQILGISGRAPEVGINQYGRSRGNQKGSMGCDEWDQKSKQRPDFEGAGLIGE